MVIVEGSKEKEAKKMKLKILKKLILCLVLVSGWGVVTLSFIYNLGLLLTNVGIGIALGSSIILVFGDLK